MLKSLVLALKLLPLSIAVMYGLVMGIHAFLPNYTLPLIVIGIFILYVCRPPNLLRELFDEELVEDGQEEDETQDVA